MIQYLNDFINYFLINLDKEFKNLFKKYSIQVFDIINIFNIYMLHVGLQKSAEHYFIQHLALHLQAFQNLTLGLKK